VTRSLAPLLEVDQQKNKEKEKEKENENERKGKKEKEVDEHLLCPNVNKEIYGIKQQSIEGLKAITTVITKQISQRMSKENLQKNELKSFFF